MMASTPVSPKFVWVVLALVQLSYCIWHVLAKKALLAGVHPLILAFYREILAVSCMYALAFKLDGAWPWARLERHRLRGRRWPSRAGPVVVGRPNAVRGGQERGFVAAAVPCEREGSVERPQRGAP